MLERSTTYSVGMRVRFQDAWRIWHYGTVHSLEDMLYVVCDDNTTYAGLDPELHVAIETITEEEYLIHQVVES